MSIGDKSLKKENLTASKLRGSSSPGRIAGSKAEKPSTVDAMPAATADVTYDASEQAMLQDVYDKVNELLAILKG